MDEGFVETEVNGVQTVWTAYDGPLRAVLMFSSGQASETSPTSGYSHLVQHLALAGLDAPAHHHNGYVDQTATVFHTEGDADHVVRSFPMSATTSRRCRWGASPPIQALLAAVYTRWITRKVARPVALRRHHRSRSFAVDAFWTRHTTLTVAR